MNLLNETLEKIQPLNAEMMKTAKERVDFLLKPVGSLGTLEEIAVQLAGITGEMYPDVSKKAMLVFAADHGVFEEGVAAAPQEVTDLMAQMIVAGKSGVAALSKQAGADIFVCDVGMKSDLEPKSRILDKKIRKATSNMRKGPAMSREEAVKSLEAGIDMAQRAINNGYNILGTGEVGISNTTASAAIIAALSGVDPGELTGAGANLSEDKQVVKAQVIRDAIALNQPDKSDAVDVLAKVGGFEIGAMAGAMLAGAANHIPVLIDGFISTAAAAIAIAIKPEAKGYLICSHASAEKGAAFASEFIGAKPFLNMGMRLGEGSGAAIAFNIVEAALYMNREMATYGDVGLGVV
ncbi:nicotinate-nucleotide--dimethylbenzimidazole phosphoribosyltransferase [Acetobacterium sp.]|uniref:nicotinate-nucleotide--dimethylbenzimidazole phosphoribosyltransferase n=1 Tax=Acetobacterium sp. TaxID=1872094 RepID=UPI003593E8B6